MTLTYIFHSGFVLETEQSILVFDYWLDPNGVMGGVLKKDKPLYVFSSHFHEDHFNRAIFEWRKQKSDITYILSKDSLRHRRAYWQRLYPWRQTVYRALQGRHVRSYALCRQRL